MKRLLFWLALYAALLGGNYMLYHLVLPIRVSFHVAALAALVLYLCSRGLPDSPLTVAALGVALALAVAIPSALDPRMAFENSWSWIVNLLLFLVLIQLCRAGHAPILLQAHFVAGGVVALSAILEFLMTRARPQGLFGNISLTGAYAAALIVPTLNAAQERQGIERLKYAALVGALLITVLIGDNRGALLSAGVAVGVYISLTWQAALYRKVALWLAALGMLGIPLLILSLAPQHATGDVVRMDLWRAGGDMIQQYPFGVGPGLFAQAYREMGSTGLNRFADAHNHIITLGAELGAPGLAAGAALLLVGLYALAGLKLSRSQRAALAALIGLACHLMVDSFPASNVAILVGLYAAFVIYDVRLHIPAQLLRAASLSAALVVLMWTSRMFMFDIAQAAYERGLKRGNAGDIALAAQLDPDLKLYPLALAHLSGQDTEPLDSNLAIYGLTMYGRVFK